MNHLILIKRQTIVLINGIKRSCRLVEFDVPAEERWQMKGSENIDKYLDIT